MKTFRPTLVATLVTAALSASAAHAANGTLVSPANFDQASTTQRVFQSDLAFQKELAQRQTKTGMRSQFDSKLGKATFVWGGVNQAKPDLALIQPEQRTAYAANYYLNALTGFSADSTDGNQAVLANLHDIKRGAVVAKYRQQVQGIEVFNKEYNVMMDREYNLVAGSGYFANKAPANKLLSMLANFGSAESAVQKAIADLSHGKANVSLTQSADKGDYKVFSIASQSGELQVAGEPRAKKVFYEVNGTLEAAYYVEVSLTQAETLDSINHSYVIQANNGKVLFRNNQVAHANEFTYRVYANEDGYPWEGPHGDVLPQAEPGIDPTEVLAAPLRTVSNYSKISTNDPWLEEDATITSGNNVFSYADVIAPQGFNDGDYTAEITSPRTFDYQLNDQNRASNLTNGKAAIVNMFYINNFLHDWWYDHGFDEASGNAQLSNYGRGGVEGDPLEVQAQDYSGLNNANMYTPADGASPRMQQYLYNDKDATNGVDQALTITSHPALGLLSSTQLSSFGPAQYDLLSGEIARVDDGDAVSSGSVTDACEALVNPEAIQGKIAIIDRGSCTFTAKVLHAQEAGAIAAIVVNNSNDGSPAPMGGSDSTVTIPSVGLNYEEGHSIYALLDNHETVTAEMFSNFPLKDSSFDNGIIAHEWGHYIQNRLVGNANGLSNFQGRAMGEGWSDFHSMMFIVKDGDRNIDGNAEFMVPYATGTYVEDFYYGIRRVPYTPNMDINPLTFQHIEEGATPGDPIPGTSVASPHAPGEIWATVLWDVYVKMLNAHDFATAQTRMADYLVAGYKLTPVAPTYTEARDALLAAMYANDPADYALALSAFARRGMGYGAKSPDRNSNSLTGVEESTATQLSTYEASSVALDKNYDGVAMGYCSNDNILDVGETGTITVTIKNAGSEVLSGITAQLQVTSGQDVTFENDGIINFDDLDLFAEEISVPIKVTLNEAATADTLEIEVTFPELAENDDVVEPEAQKITTTVNMDFSPIAPSNNSATADMETIAALADLKQNVIFGGERAAATQSLDTINTGFFQIFNSENLGEQTMFLVNNSFQSDVAVETTSVEVGYGPDFSISFWHFYWLEQSYDGGVVEISVNGGEWVDVTELGGEFSHGYTGELASELPGRQTYTGINGDLATFAGNTETISFGDSLNGQTVRFRFRVVSDGAVADFGWNIDNVTFNNIISPAFFEVVAGDTFACDNSAPKLTLSDSISVNEGTTSSVSVSVTDRNADDTHTYMWEQTAGPAASLSGANTATLSFTPADVSAATTLTFQVTVSDGTDYTTSSVNVTVNDVPVTPQEPVTVKLDNGGTLPWYSVLLLPLVWLRRRTSK
ncbi:rhombosortase-dependent M36 family metallopeptidase [Paraneptunicella aestuarii]|uniref:rhombosortase-dependent M36 family metallopeptidase n=1 Tax=Paraneptunicella aestuarii TaxID=2831148 RepID=UPI001E5E6401|nr:rhombosortase-dependent M36 family metallopeptidase [Paraneptunicella aestuarii]UAA40305.1 rhombosortase-dependent M36 family metallopeptidase [Paraneptunicella aestuarii]